MRAKGMGANVIITEIDPVKALEATMDGFQVMTMDDAAPIGDFFITVTGNKDVIVERHFMKLKDGAILSNAGHFNVEVDVTWLNNNVKRQESRPNIIGYTLPNKNTIFVIAEGKLVNIAAGDGHPVEMMDMSFAIQARAAEYVMKNHKSLKPGVIPVPDEIDSKVASDKLAACGLSIDKLTPEQEKYMNSWAL
jgi:adenosylhomocysteinase